MLLDIEKNKNNNNYNKLHKWQTATATAMRIWYNTGRKNHALTSRASEAIIFSIIDCAFSS